MWRARLKGVLVASEEPIEEGVAWLAFQAAPGVDCSAVEFRHWGGGEFPVTSGGEDLNSAPKATLAVVLSDSIFDVPEEIVGALKEALGVDDLEQRYVYP